MGDDEDAFRAGVVSRIPVRAASARGPRVLMLTATIGEGHNSTAAAVTAALRRVEPVTDVRAVDTLARMGRGTGSFLRTAYSTAIRRTPLMHDLWYHALSASRTFRSF